MRSDSSRRKFLSRLGAAVTLAGSAPLLEVALSSTAYAAQSASRVGASQRTTQCVQIKKDAAIANAGMATPANHTNGDEQLHPTGIACYHKGLPHNEIGEVNLRAYGAMTHALGARCDWMQIALVRALFMYVAILAVARVARVRLVVWRPRVLWVRSLAGTFSLFCSFYALTRLPVAEVLTLTNTYPIWIILMSWGAFGQRPAGRDLVAVACGMAGVALIERPRLGHDHVAALVALLSAFCAAVAMLGLHRLKDVDPRAVVAHFAGVASVLAATVLAWRSPVA